MPAADEVTALLSGGGYAEYAVPRSRSACPCRTASSCSKRRRCPRPSSPSGPTCSTAPAAAGRARPDPWRHQRHRHHRDPNGARLRRAGLRHRRHPPEKRAARLEPLGAERAFNYRVKSISSKCMRATDRRHGSRRHSWTWWPAAMCARNLDIAALEGRIVVISLLGGARAEINMGLILTKRLTLTGSTLRVPHGRAESRSGRCRSTRTFGRCSSAGRVRPVIHATFPLAAGQPRRIGSWRRRITSAKSS